MALDICFTFLLQTITLLAGVILLIKIPPINGVYGYRTSKSSKDIDSWKFANKTSAIIFIILSIISMSVGSLLLILKYCASINIDFVWYMAISYIVIIALPIIITVQPQIRKFNYTAPLDKKMRPLFVDFNFGDAF